MIIFEGTGVGGKDVVIMGAGTGGCLTQSGWEAMGAKNMVARDGYVSVGRDSTTHYPCKTLHFTVERGSDHI